MNYDRTRLAQCASEIADTGGELSRRGWTPATSSNFSMRLDAEHIAITISGRDKGKLDSSDIMVVDLDGNAVGTSAKSSAETLLHTQLYRRLPGVGAVLHTHSQTQTVASRLFAAQGHIRLQGYELLKAFNGQSTHETAIDVPVFANTQDMAELALKVDAALVNSSNLYGYLIDGHGIYTWGRGMSEAKRHLEAFEFLLGCELEMRRLKA